MTPSGRHPTGFCGAVPDFAALRAAAASAGGEVVEVRAVTESMGPVGAALAALAARLEAGGTLLLEVENLRSLARLRRVVEGRPGPFDPADDGEDPLQALLLPRVLAAAAHAGLHVADVVRVPASGPDPGPRLAAALRRAGLLPVGWTDGGPPARFWLRCTKARPLPGSVLIAPGDPALVARTTACLAAFLPADWEVVVGDAGSETAGWSQAVARARGDLVWFLRAGAVAGAPLFAALAAAACRGPAVPGAAGASGTQGDLSGLMLPRAEVLAAGPLPAGFANTRVALEDYCLLLQACAGAPEAVPGPFATPPPPIEAPGAFAREAEAMLARWRPALEADAEPAPGPAPAAPWEGREPRVSLCMIARDEERFLAGCLQRARAAADEIVLVDTGSKDRTVDIARSFGAQVLQQPWDDDFAAPRNAALAAATGDWILVLDADEFLVPGAAARIRELVRDPRVAGYHLRFTNLFAGGKTIGVLMVRLFRNLPGLVWQNVIHEQVTPSLLRAAGERGLRLAVADVEVEHHGYREDVMQDRGKNARNERLFAKQLQRDPDDIYTLYKYGDFLRRHSDRIDEARRLLERCLQRILDGPPALPRELPYAGEVAALCALERARAGDRDGARAVVDAALRRLLPTPNLHYVAASLALAAGRPDAALQHFRRCLGYRGQVLVVPIQDGITGHVAFAGMAQAWLQKGDLARAELLLRHALAIEPAHEGSHLLLSRLQLQRGEVQAALGTLTGFLAAHPDAAAACQQTTLILRQLGCTAQAKRMGERALRLLRAAQAADEAARMEQLLAAL